MPNLQVIGRQPMAPTQAANDLSQILDRQRTLQVQKMVAQTNSKNALSEEEKIKMSRVQNAINMIESLDKKQIPLTPDIIKQITQVQSIGEDGIFQALAQIGGAISKAGPSLDQQKTQSDISESTAKTGQINRTNAILDQYGSGAGGGNAPPGTILNAGGLSMPLNRELTGKEPEDIEKGGRATEAWAGINKALSLKKGKGLSKSIFGESSVDRSLRQSRVESGQALMTSNDPALQEFQSYYGTIRQLGLFNEAGQALTSTEREEQLKRLSLVGKSDEIIRRDLLEAVNKSYLKKHLILGGSNAAQSLEGSTRGGALGVTNEDYSTMSTEELEAIRDGR